MPNAFLETVRTKGWKEIPFPISHKKLFAAADLFLDFCTFSPEEKEATMHFLYPGNEVSRVGYFKRAQKEGAFDDKELWHHHLRTKEVLKEFEEEYPGITERFMQGGTAPKVYLRFVKYVPQKTGEFLAKGHFDRGDFAIALCESAPGLRMGKDVPSLTPMQHKEHAAIFFPGVAFPNATDDSFAPIWHDVIQKSEDQYRPDCARWAIVLFADTYDSTPPTVAEARRLLM
jgi:hypothetical protein